MRKDSTTAKLTEPEIERNKKLSKVRYIVEQYFGLSHLHDNANHARFMPIEENTRSLNAIATKYNSRRYRLKEHIARTSPTPLASKSHQTQRFGIL